ncbi:MAG: DUF3718 domain-containing protein [Paraglaciecola sp.]|uniref:DUF3718 domain-containing protein n=1 Tax=Pseudomonadati TaxID=3379134 RepID=UPI0027401D69|nr:DUF3718 domain-containing protein [Paraglaciecola sp.]MDP5030157.1 DUF3718 domain-containing protein [Paraglaciecola sp.]MDP5130430.1 DUF3718 domain-containing protein [Paraglaciecola sp.]
MLKIMKVSMLMSVVSLAFSHAVYADINADLQNICTIVKADDKDELRKKMKKVESDHKLKLQDYYSGISCSGESLIRTALLNNAVESGTLMIKKMPKNQLSSPESDGKTLSDWVAEKGLTGSPIALELNARI